MLAGTLEIQLLANIARLRQDMNEARGAVGNAMAGIERAANAAKAAIGAIGVGLSLAAIAGQVKQAVSNLAELDDMAQKTGSSVENLSRLAKVAAATGQDFGAVDAAIVKLAKGMGTVDDETNRVNQALRGLGVSAKDASGNLRDPSAVLVDIAKNLQNYRDGASKTALVQDAMGKSGADLLPYLNDVNGLLSRFSSDSKASAEGASQFLDMISMMRVRVGEVSTSFAVELLPVLNRISNAFKDSQSSATSFGTATKVISVVLETIIVLGSEVAFVFRAMGKEIGGIAAQMVALSKLDFAGFKAIGKAMKEDAAAARIEHDKFVDAVINGKKVIAEQETAKKDLNYVSGAKDAKEIKEKISDYQKLVKEIAKLTAEEQQRLSLGRDLTTAEKKLSDLMQDLASGAQKMTTKEIGLAKALIENFGAVQKLRIENEKLKKAREDIEKISTNAENAAQERTERLELENKLIGLSVVQQAILRNEYESNIALKRQLNSLDEAAKGIQDPAQIAKLKAASAARIQAIKDERKAQIEAQYQNDFHSSFASYNDPLINERVGRDFVEQEIARRQELAKQDHAASVEKISNLKEILQVEKDIKDFKELAAFEDARRNNATIQLMVGSKALADEYKEKIQIMGDEGKEFFDSAKRISQDEELARMRGIDLLGKEYDEKKKMWAEQERVLRDTVEKTEGKAQFDKAGLELQQKLFDITLQYGSAEDLINLGKEKRLAMHKATLQYIVEEKNAAIAGIGTGEELVKIKEEQLRLQKELASINVATAAKEEAEAAAKQRRLLDEFFIRDSAQKNIIADFATNFESDIRTSMLRILETGTGTISAYFKAFRNSFKTNVSNFIAKEFAKPYVMKVIMSLAGVLGLDSLAAAAGIQANAGSFTGDKVSTTSWLDAGKALWSGFSGGLSSGFEAFGTFIGQGVTSGLTEIGIGLQNIGLSETGASLINSAGNAGLGAAGPASYLGAGLAGVTIGTFIAGDKTLLGLDGMSTSAIGSILGGIAGSFIPVLGTAVGAFLGGVVGGGLNALFGSGPKKYGDTVVQGGFSGEGFTGNLAAPWKKKGGLFSGGKSGVDTAPLSTQAQDLLNSFVGKSGVAFARLIALSGDATRSIDGWTFAIDRALKTQEDFTKLFGDMANSMGTFVIPEIEKLKLEGENLADTAVRLGDEYIATESIFRLLGFTTADVGIASLGMRDSLITLMGGLQTASSTMQSFYANFFTPAEQNANQLATLTLQFKALGLTMPDTRAEFRALAETLVKDTTPAGQALFAGLMVLNPAFAAATQSTDDLTQELLDLAAATKAAMDSIGASLDKLRGTSSASLFQAELAQKVALTALTAAAPWITSMEQLQTITMEDASNYSLANKQLIANALGAAVALKDLRASFVAVAQKSVTDAFSAVQSAVQRDRDLITKAYQSSLDKVNQSVTTVTATIDKLKSLSSALKSSVDDIRAPNRAEAQAQILTALTIAKAGGGLPTVESLSGALRSIAEPSEKLFSTFVEWKSDQIRTARTLSDLSSLTDIELTVQDKQLGVLEATRQVLEGTQAATMERLDGILTRGQLQLDQMNGIDTSIISVATAVNNMGEALNNYLRVKNNEPGFVGNEPQATGTGPGGTYTFEDQARDRANAASNSLGRATGSPSGASGVMSAAGGSSFIQAWSLLNGVPYNPKLAPGPYEDYLRRLTASQPAHYRMPPGFASGGNFGGGWRVVGEHGPELENTGPSRIVSNANSKKLLNNDEVVAVVKELIATVKAGDIAIAKNTAETAKYAKRWDGNGILVRAETTAPLPVRQTA